MTLQEINTLITALEDSSCTFGNCQRLASLYVCRKYFHTKDDNQEENIEDLIPLQS